MKKVVGPQSCGLGPDQKLEPNSNFQMFSNDILSDIIVLQAVIGKFTKTRRELRVL